jgi:hypothetical protein
MVYVPTGPVVGLNVLGPFVYSHFAPVQPKVPPLLRFGMTELGDLDMI